MLPPVGIEPGPLITSWVLFPLGVTCFTGFFFYIVKPLMAILALLPTLFIAILVHFEKTLTRDLNRGTQSDGSVCRLPYHAVFFAIRV